MNTRKKIMRWANINKRVPVIFCLLAAACFMSAPFSLFADETLEVPSLAAGKVSVPGARPRDPFWPIGFIPSSTGGGSGIATPTAPAPGKETAGQPGLSAMLRIGGVVKKGDAFYATINGFTVQTGEVISVISAGQVYKFSVEKIDFNKVQVKLVER